MKRETEERIFSKDFRESVGIGIYDLKSGSPAGEEYTYPVEGRTSAVEAEICLLEKIRDAGYEVYKPVPFNLLVVTPSGPVIIILVLDSESERMVWEALNFRDKYTPVVIRDRKMKEPGGLASVTLDEAFDSFNFLNR